MTTFLIKYQNAEDKGQRTLYSFDIEVLNIYIYVFIIYRGVGQFFVLCPRNPLNNNKIMVIIPAVATH